MDLEWQPRLPCNQSTATPAVQSEQRHRNRTTSLLGPPPRSFVAPEAFTLRRKTSAYPARLMTPSWMRAPPLSFRPTIGAPACGQRQAGGPQLRSLVEVQCSELGGVPAWSQLHSTPLCAHALLKPSPPGPECAHTSTARSISRQILAAWDSDREPPNTAGRTASALWARHAWLNVRGAAETSCLPAGEWQQPSTGHRQNQRPPLPVKSWLKANTGRPYTVPLPVTTPSPGRGTGPMAATAVLGAARCSPTARLYSSCSTTPAHQHTPQLKEPFLPSNYRRFQTGAP